MEDNGAWDTIAAILMAVGAIIAFCCATVIAVAIAGAASAGGVLWGGGTAILNYGSSFKENMIDSNRTAA